MVLYFHQPNNSVDVLLKHGVTVTLQILVLSFWVRIPVLHQRFGCKLVRMVGPQQRLKKTRVPGKDRQVSLIKNLLVRTRRYLISPIHTSESRGLWNIKHLGIKPWCKKRLSSGRGDLQLQVTELLNIADVDHRPHLLFAFHFAASPLTGPINGPTHWYFITRS